MTYSGSFCTCRKKTTTIVQISCSDYKLAEGMDWTMINIDFDYIIRECTEILATEFKSYLKQEGYDEFPALMKIFGFSLNFQILT